MQKCKCQNLCETVTFFPHRPQIDQRQQHTASALYIATMNSKNDIPRSNRNRNDLTNEPRPITLMDAFLSNHEAWRRDLDSRAGQSRFRLLDPSIFLNDPDNSNSFEVSHGRNSSARSLLDRRQRLRAVLQAACQICDESFENDDVDNASDGEDSRDSLSD